MKARWILLGALLPYVGWLIVGYHYHFLDGVNLLLHEAGHVLFGLFGQTFHFLGGTLGQLVFPALFVGYFWRRGQRFEAFIVLIWLAESLMYAAEYIGDARRMVLPLVGGHIHDWNWLLRHWGALDHAEGLGTFVHAVASLLALGAIGCAAAELKRMGASACATRSVYNPAELVLPASASAPEAAEVPCTNSLTNSARARSGRTPGPGKTSSATAAAPGAARSAPASEQSLAPPH